MMDKIKRNRLMIRWSFGSAATIALFWGVWWLMAGSVPEVTSVPLWPGREFTLPFAVSRWWDVLLGPIASCLLVLDLYRADSLGQDCRDNVFIGLVAGLALGLAFGLMEGLACGLAFGLACRLVFGLAFGLALWLAFGLALGLAHGLAGTLSFLVVVGAALTILMIASALAGSVRAAGRWLAGSESALTGPPAPADLPTDADPRRVRLAELGEEIETKRVEALRIEQQLAEENPDPFRSAPLRR